MRKTEWQKLKDLSLDEKKALLEKTKKDIQASHDDWSKVGKLAETIAVLQNMIDFKPDPDCYKKKAAAERHEKNMAKYYRCKSIAIIKGL